MSLVQFLRILAARKAIIWATLLACFLTATLTVFLLPPRYESTNRILVDVSQADPTTGLVMTPSAANNYLATQLRLITDPQTAGPVVDALGWTTDPNLQASFEAAGRPGGDIREWLAQQILEGTTAKFTESPNIIEIAYRANNPATAQRIAEGIREGFLAQHLAKRQASSQRGEASYREQARRAAAQLTQAEELKTRFAKENGIVMAGDNIDLESSKLSALSAQSAVPSMPRTAMPSSPARMQLETVKQQIAQAQQTLGANHPTLQSLERQRQVLEAEAGRTPTMIGGSSRAEIEGAYQAQKARVLAQADKLDRLNQLQADIAVKRDQYVKLTSKAEEMAGQATVRESNIEPLGNSSLPSEPAWPNKPLVMIGSIAIGLVLGLLIALFVELLARRVRSHEDLEHAVGAPVLAIVGLDPSTSLTDKIVGLLDRRGAARRRALAEA